MKSRYIKTHLYDQWRSDNLEKIIARLYCLSLPFRMIVQLSFLKDIFKGSAEYLPFIFHVLGLLLWLVNEGGKYRFNEKEALIKDSVWLISWLNASSIIMAIVIQSTYGNHGSESAYQGILGMLIYFVQYLLMFLYNYRVFQLISVDELNKLLHIDCVVLLIIGYMQVLVMNGVGGTLYNRIDFLDVLNPSTELPKLCLTGIEGAAAGCIICVFVFPILLSNIIMGNRNRIIETILWIVPLYYTYSSTAYVLFLVDLVVFVILLMMKSNNPSQSLITLLIILLCVIIIIFFLFQTNLLNDSIIEEINYLLFQKATDKTNGSTISRTVTMLANWGAFAEFPILGVGNGLQGYFYEKYFPSWAMDAAGSDVGVFLKRSREGINNGGIFIPGLISGYGIVGCILILLFVWQCIRNNAEVRTYSQNFYYAYIISGICFVVMGFQGDAYGLYFAWFMLSIPFMTKNREEST